jgi:hypothetical protein
MIHFISFYDILKLLKLLSGAMFIAGLNHPTKMTASTAAWLRQTGCLRRQYIPPDGKARGFTTGTTGH